MSVEDVTFGYSPEKILLRNVDFGIHMSSRVSIVGPNGIGKSTLVKLIEGDLVPLSGEVRRNQRLRIGKYSQHFVDKVPFDYFIKCSYLWTSLLWNISTVFILLSLIKNVIM